MESQYPTYRPTRSIAPRINYPVCSDDTFDGQVNSSSLPAYPVPQPDFTNCPLRPMGNVDSTSAASYSNTTTNWVDVDKIIRLKRLNNNVYLISRNDAGVNHRVSGTQSLGNEDGVELGVVVNDSPTGPPTAAAVHVPQSRGRVQQSMRRLIFSLRKQVQELQYHMAEVESEFQVRFHREKELAAKLHGLIERNNAAAKFKCDQATQVNIVESTSQREKSVQTCDLYSTTRDPASNPLTSSTDSLEVTKEREPSINEETLPSGNLNGVRTSTPATGTDETVDQLLVTLTKQQPGWSRECWSDSSSSEFEDKGHMKTYAERRSGFISKFVSGDSTRCKHLRSWISPSTNAITSYDTSDSDCWQDFPSDHPFRRSRDIFKPPKVPANYCDACYEKTNSRMRRKFCYTCRALVGRLRKAYIANRDTQLPDCDHTMGDPKRNCKGCIFKVYTYRHNRRNPTNLLPFPREDQENTPINCDL